jgi:PEP-CTERM motif
MKRFVLPLLALLALAGVAGAATVTCPAPPNGGVPADVIGLTISCGGLTFSNFNVIPAGGFRSGVTPTVDLVTVDFSGGSVNLNLNPNMTAPSGSQDIHFYYQVSGPATGVDLALGGVNATVIERVCSQPIASSGAMANTCPSGSSLANFVAFSTPPGPNTASVTFPSGSGSSFYVYKDLGVTAGQLSPGGGALTSFTQSWETGGGGGQVPEPASMLLIGSGFIALGMLRRRVRKA